MELALFCFFAFIAIVTSVGVIWARNPLHSALSLIAAFFALSAIYVLLEAHLLAAIQVLVYAGAVMVLFIFVIMLLNLKDEELGTAKPTAMKIAGGIAVGLGGAAISFFVLRSPGTVLKLEHTEGFGTVEAVGRVMYGTYVLPFEVTSLLLLVAIVAAVVIAKAKI